MLRLKGLCLAFVLLGAAAPIIAPATGSGATETAVRDREAPPRRQSDTVRRGAGNRAGSAVEETGPDTRAAVAEPETTEPVCTRPECTEPAEIEPLIPIETQNSIRVNANVSLPQDI